MNGEDLAPWIVLVVFLAAMVAYAGVLGVATFFLGDPLSLLTTLALVSAPIILWSLRRIKAARRLRRD